MTSLADSLIGRTVIVTGAAGGIGSAIVGAFSERGAHVVLVDAAEAVHELAGHAAGEAVFGDICDVTVTNAAIDAALDANGRIDVLVNAAGIQMRMPAVEIDDTRWERLVAVNLSAAYRLCRAASVHLSATNGSIVNVSSLSADRAIGGIVPYGITKAAISQLTRGLAVELGPTGVRVNAVAPGYVETPMTADLLADGKRRESVTERIPLRRLAAPEDIAPAVVFLASDAAHYITGCVLPVDGGYAAT